nr:copper chaperone PCu(A)C [Schlegelella koreensis]
MICRFISITSTVDKRMKARAQLKLRSTVLSAALFGLTSLALAAEDVTVTAAWARPTVRGQSVGGAYFDIRSERGATLTDLRSDAAASVQLHSMTRDGDIMRMRELATLPLPPGEVVHLAPSGTHAMLLDLRQPLRAGESIPLELTVADAQGRRRTLQVIVPIRTAAPVEHSR